MIRYEFKDKTGKNWVRISKSEARKLFDKGETICLCPCKMRPFGGWGIGYITDSSRTECDFEKLSNKFSWYNCNPETGKYVSFYKMEV